MVSVLLEVWSVINAQRFPFQLKTLTLKVPDNPGITQLVGGKLKWKFVSRSPNSYLHVLFTNYPS